VFVAGRQVAVERFGDIVHAQYEVIGRSDTLGTLHPVDLLEQRHDMACAAFGNDLVQVGQATNVNHQVRFNHFRCGDGRDLGERGSRRM